MITKVQNALTGVGVGYFDTGMTCPYDRYDLYFNDENLEIRRSALTAFVMMLGTWHSRSSFSFTPQHKRKFNSTDPNETWNELHHYIKAFVTHHQDIKRDFPVLYSFMIWFFIHIEKESLLTYEEKFPELDSSWCTRLRQEILLKNIDIKMPPMKNFFIETGITPFFESDL